MHFFRCLTSESSRMCRHTPLLTGPLEHLVPPPLRRDPRPRRTNALRFRRAREASLLFEQGLQRVFGLFGPVAATTSTTCPLGAPRDIVVAEIGPLLIENALGRDFLAFIVGVLVVKIALLTTAEISIAMGTGILPAHLPLNSDHIPAKDTIHYPCSSSPNRAKPLISVLLVPNEMAVCDGFHRASVCYSLSQNLVLRARLLYLFLFGLPELDQPSRFRKPRVRFDNPYFQK